MLQRIQVPRFLALIAGASFLLNFAFGGYRAIFSNFTGQELQISYAQYGVLEGVREIPGLLTILLVGLVYRLRDEQIYVVSGGLIGVGIWLYATAHSFSDLIIATLVQSVGFHVWHVVQESMVMKAVDLGDRARRLGQVNSVAAAATLLGMGLVTVSTHFFSLRNFFVIFGVVGIGGALFALLFPRSAAPVKPVRFVFNWRYRSYYVLTLLAGARRHIVSTFAIFALVRLYDTPVQTMAMLLAAISFIAIWTRPYIGKLIDRMGEQRALSLSYALLALVFLGYALIRNAYVAYGLFVLDNVLLGFEIAVATHAGRIIPREELSASLATGLTINHIFGVAVPVAGGFLWQHFGATIPFLMGMCLVLVGMAYSWNLDERTRAAGYAQTGD